MSVVTSHAGPWTEEEYLALGETQQRVELLDGSLLMSPNPGSDHQQVARRLANALEAAAPSELEVVEAVNLRVGPSRLLIPDILVSRRLERTTVFQAADVLLVAEVVSPSTTSADRVLKPALYAGAGIGWYLRVELAGPDAPELWLHQLRDGVYAEVALLTAGTQGTLAGPFPVTLDPAALRRRSGRPGG
jgi:Uma2 family endonuclease